MITRLLIILLSSILVCCGKKPAEYFTQVYIRTFYHPDSTSIFPPGASTEPGPLGDSSKKLFVLVDSNRIAYVTKGSLSEIYQEHFSLINFYDFLYEALNQKTVFPSSMIPRYIGYKFRLNKSITNVYLQNGIEPLLRTYFEKTESAYCLQASLEDYQQFTILYYVFLNGYEIGFDDYRGLYHAYKRTL